MLKFLKGCLTPNAGLLYKLLQKPLPFTVALLSLYLRPFHHSGTSQVDVQGQRPQETIDDVLAACTLGDCDGQVFRIGRDAQALALLVNCRQDLGMVPYVSVQVDGSVVVVSNRFRLSSLGYLSVLFVRRIGAGSSPISCVEERGSIFSPGPLEQWIGRPIGLFV